MKRSIFGPIIFGILLGAAAFFAPFFLLKAVFFFMIIGFIMRMFWWRRHGWHHRYQYQLAYADKIRSMSDEEYAGFKNKFKSCGDYYHGRCAANYTEHGCCYNRCDKNCDNTPGNTNTKENNPG
jgi:hypothetical protein